MEKNDIEILKFLQTLVDTSDKLTVVELGGCDAYHTKILTDFIGAKLANYYVAEANPSLWSRFDKMPATLIRGAVNDYDGKCTLWVSNPKYSGSSSIREPYKHKEVWPECTFDKQVEIDCFKLDTLKIKYDIGIVDFI